MYELRNEESGELMRRANRIYRNPNPLTSAGMDLYGRIKNELAARQWKEDAYLCGGCAGTCRDSHLNMDQIADEVTTVQP